MSIILSGVSFHYANQQPLFESVNLSVATGRKVSVIGNNGTGKSTLLKLIAGELTPSSGSIRCASTPYYIPQQIGITGISVSQALNVSDKIEALHAIYAGSEKYEYYDILADDWDIESRCRTALDDWGLPKVELNTPIDSLSGGEKTKLFLAGMSIHRPSVILLDEPTNHLDYKSRRKLYEFISHSGATVMVVSHEVTLLNLLEDTYEISPKGVKRYGGNYDFYKAQKEIEEQALNQQINAEETALRLARKKAKEVNERQEKRSRQGEKNKDQVPRIMRKTLKDSRENTGARLKDKHTAIIEQNRQRLADLRQKQNVACELKLNFENTLLHNGKVLISAHRINFRYDTGVLLQEKPLDIENRNEEHSHLKEDNDNTAAGNITSQSEERIQSKEDKGKELLQEKTLDIENRNEEHSHLKEDNDNTAAGNITSQSEERIHSKEDKGTEHLQEKPLDIENRNEEHSHLKEDNDNTATGNITSQSEERIHAKEDGATTKAFLWKNPLDIEIRSGERIHLKGDNGSGKTTLLKLFIGELPPSTGKIIKADFSFVYLDQEYSKVKTSRTLLELAQMYNHRSLPDHELKLRLHRALFPKEMWDKPCHVLSGGERMRLYLCCLMISNQIPDVFILDEPTNNLDLLSLQILTSTIKNYRGTVLIVSHDQRFVEEIGITRVMELYAYADNQ